MIDIESGTIIDMVASRETKQVAAWLKTFPNLKVIARDGSLQYAKAISIAHPSAIQVNDRFHLIKNLTDYCKSYLNSIIKFKIKIKGNIFIENKNIYSKSSKLEKIELTKSLFSEGLKAQAISKKLQMDIRTVNNYIETPINELEFNIKDVNQKRHEKSVQKKQERIDIVKKLHKQGFNNAQICRETGFAKKTVKRYLDPNVSAVQRAYGSTRISILSKYHSTIDELLSKKHTFKEIEDSLRKQGYQGSASSIRMYSSKKRKLEKEILNDSELKDNFIFVERKELIKLLYKPLEKVQEISHYILEKVYEQYPVLLKLYDVIKKFKNILVAKKENELEYWIKETEDLNIPELNSFIQGIKADIISVKNAIKYTYSNGLAEGSINKIKVIKRIMYGRCSFDYLRRKILELEKRKLTN